MKRAKFVVHEPSVNKAVGSEMALTLNDEASVVDAITEIDKLIKNSVGSFPLPDYLSLLHMVYNPLEGKFYKQVAVAALKTSGEMLNVRDNAKQKLPNDVTIILIPTGGCISEWEEAISPEEFSKALHRL
jgi:hypothetical protein